MLLLLLSIFTYVSADADAQVPISVPGVQYYRYPTPALDAPIVTPALRSPIVTPALNTPIVTPADETGPSLTPALRSPIVTQALNTPIITPALGAPPIVLPAGQEGVALRSQFLQPALGGGLYYTHSPYTPSKIYYTPNTAFKKTPEDSTKLIRAYTDLSPETKNSYQNEVSARTGKSRQSWSSSKTICRSAASRHSCKRSSLRTDVLRTMARDHLEIRPRSGLVEMGWSLRMIRTCWNITL